MKYFIDTEFIESGPYKPVQLLSIGIVAEDGREFYAESCEANPNDASPWVMENVVTHLTGDAFTLNEIKAGILGFLMFDPQPEFWGYYADYDWVVFCQIFGTMMDLPTHFPKFCRDIKQLAMDLGNPTLPKQTTTEHHALADARWNHDAFKFLQSLKSEGASRVTAERQRQVSKEGWTPEHDDQHENWELALAAMAYLRAYMETGDASRPPLCWPWSHEDWKPTDGDPARDLVKAGALIAAEIDRLLRIEERSL